MPGGRPTDDPKQTLVAVRLAARQMRALKARSKRERIGLSEALRRCVDEWARATSSPLASSPPRARPPTKEERDTFDQLFAAFGLKPKRRRRPRR
jgi:hypothetical protein